MLAFDQDQFDQLAQDGWVTALTRHWQQSWPILFRSLPDAEQRRLALNAVRAAQAHGITLERDVYTWCDLCIVARTDFAAAIPLHAMRPHGGR